MANDDSGTTVGHTLTVVEVIEETRDATSIVMRRPEGAVDFDYRPGQFLTVRIPSDRTGHVARSYSLSSTPDLDQLLKVTVKRTVGGYGSNWLCDNVTVGSQLTVLPPSGRFTPAGYDGDLLLFAAGSGITPVISILKAALHRSSGKVELFYANRDAESVIFAREVDALLADHGTRLVVHHWHDAEQGHPTASVIASVAAGDLSRDAYVCGPAPFMEVVAEGLRQAGLPPEQHHQEVFLSLSGDPFAAPTPVADGATSGRHVPTVVSVEGDEFAFDWPADQTLVDVLLARGVEVPYSCRSGECGSCACTVRSGSVEMASCDILAPEDIADGYVLGCQSRPVEGPIVIEF